MRKIFFFSFLTIFILLPMSFLDAGNVYLVIGSDTAIWDGMNTSRYNNFYNIDLYVNPERNAYKIMDPALRARLVDSDGQPLKMTWWMMAGNIFRYATNKNVPIPNIMTMYLMKKYHGKNVLTNGDELSLHYHTFIWSDFNQDAHFYWNQADKFMDCFDDFNYTLSQFLLEEQIFPVSFRSGWHYMDNDWQHYLDDYILPYSLHNDYPAKHLDLEEPIDNNYDWSLAPATFVPFRPSRENYQLPGDGPGWNVRSAHFYHVLHDDLIDTVFAAAQNGQDQVACFWGHLPESDFIQNIERINTVAHDRIKNYPDVKFYYCTAIEAMQRWRNSPDFQPPEIEFQEKTSGEDVYFEIRTHEKIFQKTPFIAVKDVYEDYQVLSCQPIGINTWQTSIPVKRKFLAKAGAAVCDTLGNQTLKFLQYLPDDVFIDNSDDNFTVIGRNWREVTTGIPWGMNAHVYTLSDTDSAIARWEYIIEQQAYYNFFIHVPDIQNLAGNLFYIIYTNQTPIDTLNYLQPLTPNKWHYLTTIYSTAGDEVTVELKVCGAGQNSKNVVADVLKISAMVRDRDLQLTKEILDFGEISCGDTISTSLHLKNLGLEILSIRDFLAKFGKFWSDVNLPLEINPMSEAVVIIKFSSEQMGFLSDTLFIESNDPKKPLIKLPVIAKVEKYFKIIDNEDSVHYQEYGEWFYSVAQAYGETSRYAWLNTTPKPYARFFTRLKKSGVYNLLEIVPKTENASNYALYEIRVDNVITDSVYIDQNEGSGNWKSLGLQFFSKDVPVEIRVIDSGKSTAGAVLRADAVKFLLIREVTEVNEKEERIYPFTYQLNQNYPNPFNSSTTIQFSLPRSEHVQLYIFNLLGEKVKTLVDKMVESGSHKILWDGRNNAGQPVSSGIYYYKILTPEFTTLRKMILIK